MELFYQVITQFGECSPTYRFVRFIKNVGMVTNWDRGKWIGIISLYLKRRYKHLQQEVAYTDRDAISHG